MFKILIVLLISFITPFVHAEIDKTEYTWEEKLAKIEKFNWQNNLESPIIDDPDANAYIDLRGFPYV